MDEVQARIVAAFIGAFCGGLVAGLFGIIAIIAGVWLSHYYSLKEDSIKRQRDEIYDDAKDLREKSKIVRAALSLGAREAAERGTYEQ